MQPKKSTNGWKMFGMFVLGFFIGIIALTGTVGGVGYYFATNYTLNKVQKDFNVNIPLDNDKLMNMSFVELISTSISTISTISTTPLKTVASNFGFTLPSEIQGIDVSAVWNEPITSITNALPTVISGVNLQQVGALTGIDFVALGVPLLSNNLQAKITDVFGIVKSAIDSSKMSLNSLKNDFAVDIVGQNQLLSKLQFASFDNLAKCINLLNIDSIVSIDKDGFIKAGDQIFVKIDDYELVEDFTVESQFSKKYIAGVDNLGAHLVEKELRFVKVSETGQPDKFEPYFGEKLDGQSYYRFIEYTPFNPAIHTTQTEFFVKQYADIFVETATSVFEPLTTGFFKLNNLKKFDGTNYVDLDSYKTPLQTGLSLYFDTFASQTPTFTLSDEVGSPTDTLSSNSHFDTALTGFYKVYLGSSEKIMQALSHLSVAHLSSATEIIKNLQLGDLISIDTSQHVILQKIKTYKLNELTKENLQSEINNLALGDFIAVDTNSSKILKALQSTKLGEIDSTIKNNLKISDMIEFDQNSFLNIDAVKNSTLATVEINIKNSLKACRLVDLAGYGFFNMSPELKTAIETYETTKNTKLTMETFIGGLQVDAVNGKIYFPLL